MYLQAWYYLYYPAKSSIHEVTQNFWITGYVEKSSLYIAGVATHTKEEILKQLGYTEGTLLFRYLEVPLASKKLSVNHYLPLIEKLLHDHLLFC